MRCHVRIGKLVSHPCGRKGRTRCVKCSNPACARHVEGGTCDTCRGVQPPEATVHVSWDEMFTFTDDEAALFDGRGRPDDPLRDLDS